MDFNHFARIIDTISTKQLGGQNSQFKMVPKSRLAFSKQENILKNPRKAAVLALCYPNKNNQTCILLTERASYKGTHSAQISFPGGKEDITDINLMATALRETHEEVGVASNNIKIIRQLSNTYIPPSNFLVTPFLGYTTTLPLFIKNNEVANLIQITLQDLLNNANTTSHIINTSYAINTEVPCYKLNDYIVWGATAMILSEIKDLIKL